MIPPFKAGWQARKDGLPLDANPYKPAPYHPDDYPGKHVLWRDGWRTCNNTIEHDAERALQKKTGGVK